jgi:ADP-ribose pyrophosphatase YjhB (NUDIX family)
MTYRTGKFWQPDVTVATVVVRDGRFLMVEETVQSRLVLNQPAGHLEPDESVLEAAMRETLEETAWKVEIQSFIGAYQWKAPETGRHYLRFAFAAAPIEYFAEQKLDDGIVQALWMTPAELQDQAARHRSPLVWKVAEDFLAGQRHPLSLLNHIA